MQHVALDLVKGLETKARADGSVVGIKAGKTTVAELVVGTMTVRVNFRQKVTGGPKVALSGKSAKWAGGGVVVTEANSADVRKLLELAVTAAGGDAPKTVARLKPRKAGATTRAKARQRPEVEA
jgi:hypothetical protein